MGAASDAAHATGVAHAAPHGGAAASAAGRTALACSRRRAALRSSMASCCTARDHTTRRATARAWMRRWRRHRQTREALFLLELAEHCPAQRITLCRHVTHTRSRERVRPRRRPVCWRCCVALCGCGRAARLRPPAAPRCRPPAARCTPALRRAAWRSSWTCRDPPGSTPKPVRSRAIIGARRPADAAATPQAAAGTRPCCAARASTTCTSCGMYCSRRDAEQAAPAVHGRPHARLMPPPSSQLRSQLRRSLCRPKGAQPVGHREGRRPHRARPLAQPRPPGQGAQVDGTHQVRTDGEGQCVARTAGPTCVRELEVGGASPLTRSPPPPLRRSRGERARPGGGEGCEGSNQRHLSAVCSLERRLSGQLLSPTPRRRRYGRARRRDAPRRACAGDGGHRRRWRRV